MRNDAEYQSCALRLKGLADPDRLQIVTCLLNGDKSVTGIADEVVAPSRVQGGGG